MPSAARVRWAKFRVSVVAVVSFAILGVLVYLLTGGTLLTPKVTIYVYIADATGLLKGSPVSVNGVDVGKVSKVELSGSNDPNRIVRLSMEVEESHLSDIPQDSTAEIGAETAIGDKFVDITRGRDPTHVLSGGEIQFKPSQDLMKSLDLTQFARQLRQVDADIRDVQEGRNQTGQFFTSEEIYDKVLAGVTKIQAAFRVAVQTTGQVGSWLYSDQLYRQIEQPLLDLDQTLARLQAGQGDAGRLLRDPAQHAELLRNVADVRQSIATVHSATFIQSDTLYTDLVGSLASLIERVDEMQQNPLLATSEMYDNLNGMAREIMTTAHDFRGNPKKFLRLKLF